MQRTRKIAYAVSAVAILCFFLVPDPELSVLGALVLQTLAFVIVAGKSPLDGLLLSGISLILIGLLPAEHPFVAGAQAYQQARWVLLTTGVGLAVLMLAIIVYRLRR
jgi:hypothetical protein